MGLGSTAKKMQTLADRAEQLYAQLKDVRERVIGLEQSVEGTTERVDALETESEKQFVLLKAIAEEQGIDAEQVLADAAIDEAEADAEQSGEGDANDVDATDANATDADTTDQTSESTSSPGSTDEAADS